MRKFIALVLFATLFSGYSMQAQEDANEPKKMTWGMDVFHDVWMGLPGEMETHTILPGINAFALYNFPIGKSDFIFSSGLSLGIHNLKNNMVLGLDSLEHSTFTVLDSKEFEKSKLSLTYWDIPLELKYKNKNGLLIGIGFKYGFLFKAQTKLKADNPETEVKDILTTKQSGLPNFESNRYGLTFRAGYKKISFFGYYSLSKVFTAGRGPEMYPISVGVSFFPY
jgi:hypothetical protein